MNSSLYKNIINVNYSDICTPGWHYLAIGWSTTSRGKSRKVPACWLASDSKDTTRKTSQRAGTASKTLILDLLKLLQTSAYFLALGINGIICSFMSFHSNPHFSSRPFVYVLLILCLFPQVVTTNLFLTHSLIPFSALKVGWKDTRSIAVTALLSLLISFLHSGMDFILDSSSFSCLSLSSRRSRNSCSWR